MRLPALLAATFSLATLSLGFAAEPQLLQGSDLPFPDGVKARDQISAIGKLGDFLVLGVDEGVGPEKNRNVLQVLQEESGGGLRLGADLFLFEGDKTDGKEMDIEGIAVDGSTVYATGSHGKKRPRTKSKNKVSKNRRNFESEEIEAEPNRGRLYRVYVDASGQVEGGDYISLLRIIRDDPVLGLFSEIPSKENGVDIEGLAVRDGLLYAGFRSPVLRGKHVPVMRFDYETPRDYELLYVTLGGRGIRDITAVSDGFLIVAGPSGEGPGSYQIHHWDGKDMVGGKNLAPELLGRTALLGTVDPPHGGKAEGLVVLEEAASAYDAIIVFDGSKDVVARRYRIPR